MWVLILSLIAYHQHRPLSVVGSVCDRFALGRFAQGVGAAGQITVDERGTAIGGVGAAVSLEERVAIDLPVPTTRLGEDVAHAVVANEQRGWIVLWAVCIKITPVCSIQLKNGFKAVFVWPFPIAVDPHLFAATRKCCQYDQN
jgi:hypothetical protein